MRRIKNSKNKSLLTLVAVLLTGFTISLYVYALTLNYSADLGNDTCQGAPHSEGLGYVNGGAPFDSRQTKEFFGVCGEAVNVSKAGALSQFLGTWQFYANGVVWALPIAAAAYLIRRPYAHNRY
jgi:hypothetical protein